MAMAQENFTQVGIAVVSVHWPAAMRARVMTPIVFWASLVPWASETSDALPIWPHRKPWLVNCSATFATTRKMNQVPTAATTPAMTGEATAGRITLPMTPSSLVPSPVHFTPLIPSAAMAEPMSPPNRACEDDDGRPSSHVRTFQTIPPTRPARMMRSSA